MPETLEPDSRRDRLSYLFDAQWEGTITPAEEAELTRMLEQEENRKDYEALESLARVASRKERPAGDFYEALAKSLPDHPRRTPAEVGLEERPKRPARLWMRPPAWGPALAAASAILGGVAMHIYETPSPITGGLEVTCLLMGAVVDGQRVPLSDVKGNWPQTQVFHDGRSEDDVQFSGQVCVEKSLTGCAKWKEASIYLAYRCGN